MDEKEFSVTLGARAPIPFDTLTEMVLDTARTHYDRPAVRGPRRRRRTPSYVELSYGQFVWSAHHVAEKIVALDAVTEARPYCAVLLPRTSAFPVAALGVLLAGGAYLPCYESLPAARLRHYLDDSGAAVLVTTRKLHALVPARSLERYSECSVPASALVEIVLPLYQEDLRINPTRRTARRCPNSTP